MSDRSRGTGERDRPSERDNPFAPPPEGRPDQPWHPRGPADGRPQADEGDGGRGDGGAGGDREGQRQRWGSQWSRRQPRQQSGGFGEPPGGQEDGPRGGRRWDPTDPAQRHARYAVLAGMWGVFAGLLGWEWLGLLLGALALYWGFSALRGGPKESREGTQRERLVAGLEGKAPDPARREPRPGGPRPQFAAAMAGLVLASTALTIVAASYTVQLVYRDYYDCVRDALTTPSREACERHLPENLRPLLGEQD